MTKLSTFTLVCGMEVHAELKTQSKMFCSCVNDPFHAPQPNMYTCPVCLGMPGGLPVANQKAIEWVLKLGLALNCQINLFSKFDRKHYFYPDLPKGYQISQYDIPFCTNGFIETQAGRVRIRRIHLEEDTGKLQHKTIDGKKVTLIDFNRSGVPLVEIVTEPDIISAAQAKEYGRKLRQILRYLDIADCDMEQGGMRLEANISLRPSTMAPDQFPDYKVEVKNINSFRFVEQAIAFEIDRQSNLLAAGTTPSQETRGWNPQKGETFSQRTKEAAEDYRYFPDPDLPPVRFTSNYLDELRASLPELPDNIVTRWQNVFGVEPRFGLYLSEEQSLALWTEKVFEQAQSQNVQPNKIASAIVNKKFAWDVTQEPSLVLQSFKDHHQTATVDSTELNQIIQQLLTDETETVHRYRAGQKQLLNFFLGQTMKRLGKKVDAQQIKAILVTFLDQ